VVRTRFQKPRHVLGFCFLAAEIGWIIFLHGVELVKKRKKESAMDVGSVSSGANVYTNAAKQSPQSQQAQEAQALERRQPRPEERVEKQEEAPKPVKNAQGQTTGSVISVTA
jgi:hypothetical protein